MSTALGDILKHRQTEEPREIQVIKEFIRAQFQADCQVSMQSHQIIIHVSSAPLAGALRMKLHELQKFCDTPKRLVIRIKH